MEKNGRAGFSQSLDSKVFPQHAFPSDWLFRLIPVVFRSGGIPIRAIEPTIKDPISQLVVESLIVRGPSTVSGVARYVKRVKGTSSRTTIRERLASLEISGVSCRCSSGSEWMLTNVFVRQIWSFCTHRLLESKGEWDNVRERDFYRTSEP